jgi:hypothetical protein
MRRIALTLLIMGLLLALTAVPAFAFHHVFLPAPDCAAAQSGDNAGGNNPTAKSAIIANNPAQGQSLPLPPAGTAAVDASPVIGPGATCPAGQ